MIVLDTNVLSEPLRPAPDQEVISWLDRQPLETLYLTSITLAEMRAGILALPSGKRRTTLNERFGNEVVPRFVGRILSFDEPASICFAEAQDSAKSRGRALGVMDGLIAAICISSGFALATRNTRDFETIGIALINPWNS